MQATSEVLELSRDWKSRVQFKEPFHLKVFVLREFRRVLSDFFFPLLKRGSGPNKFENLYSALLREGFRADEVDSLSPLLESILLRVHGPSGSRLYSKDPLPPIASKEEVEATRSHVFETFYPISPTLGLQECNIYDTEDDTGEVLAAGCGVEAPSSFTVLIPPGLLDQGLFLPFSRSESRHRSILWSSQADCS